MSGTRRRPVGWAPAHHYWPVVVAGLLVILPFVAVRFPPLTDLPQSVAQIRLLHDALADPESPYRVQHLAPNQLVYWLLGGSWAIVGARDAGRAAAALVALLWVVAVFALGRDRGRPVSGALLASLFVWNHGFYYGFLSFHLGFAVFCLWLVLLRRLDPALPGAAPPGARAGPDPGLREDLDARTRSGRDLREVVALAAASLLLYTAHLLWLAAALVWLAVDSLRARLPWRRLVLRAAAVTPAALAAVLWSAHLASEAFTSTTRWGAGPLRQLFSFDWWVHHALGGIPGAVEPVVLLAAGLWTLGALLQRRGVSGSRTPDGAPREHAGWDRELLFAGLLLVALAVSLPGLYSRTLHFGSRWLPMGVALLALALPPLALRPALRRAAALALVATLGLSTAAAWVAWERRDLDGFEEVLDALPPGSALVGILSRERSSSIRGFPLHHLAAYGQAFSGARLHASFADLATSPVVFRELPRRVPWTPGVLRREDLRFFDYALFLGDEGARARFVADVGIRAGVAARAVARRGEWTLYELGTSS